MLKFQYNGSTKSVWLIGPVMKVGSAKNSELLIPDEDVAALHCKINVNQNDIELEPVSPHEIYVNEVLLKKKAPLKVGDLVRIGTKEFILVDPNNKSGSSAPAASPQPLSANATVFRAPITEEMIESTTSGWYLKGLHKNLSNKRYPIDGTMNLGRSPECELHFSYDRLSRVHAEFKILDGNLLVKDLDSSNGTFVNGEKTKQCKLRDGDIVSFDKLEFSVVGPTSGAGAGVVLNVGNMGQTVVRSAITPEMMKQATKAAATNNAKKEEVAAKATSGSAGIRQMLSSTTFMIVVTLVVVIAVILAVVLK